MNQSVIEPSSATRERSPGLGRGCWLALLFFIGVPLVLLLVGIAVFFGRDRAARQKVKAKIAERQAAELPYDNASMQAYHERLTTDKQTDAWLRVLAELSSEDFSASVSGVPIFDGQLDAPVPKV
ncbi:MAG: hypothetical protein R3C53_23220 [Pirellulaceae bacterium]